MTITKQELKERMEKIKEYNRRVQTATNKLKRYNAEVERLNKNKQAARLRSWRGY